MIENIKTIFFDYDGTLHDSMHTYKPALKKAYKYLVEQGLAEDRELTDSEIKHWLGFNSVEMWKNFMPDISEDMQYKARKMVGNEMKKLINEGKAVLYDGSIDTLEYLKKKGYHLVFVSNCSFYYRDSHNKAFGLDKYFDELGCAEEYNYVPKHEYVKEIMKRYPKEMIIVGDRHHDMIAGKENNIKTIGCAYGFSTKGELDEADIIINDITDLKNYL